MHSIKYIINHHQFETITILKELSKAHRYLGELKGLCQTLPNQKILIDTLSLQEAQDSTEIENIITTQDKIFKYRLQKNNNPATKEVFQYNHALNHLSSKLKPNNLITINNIIEAQQIIKNNQAGIRKQAGTKLIDETTGKTIYTPPPPEQLIALLNDLENFINTTDSKIDALIKLAIIHHQFEKIHPFYDGNGRMGRIINVVYLVQQDLLPLPILYLSRYINHNKKRYYELLKMVDEKDQWEEWVVFMLKAVSTTSQSTLNLVVHIKELQQSYKNIIREQHHKIYSQDLLNNIFKYPYTKTAFLEKNLKVSRLTANRYLNQLVTSNLLSKHKLGKENYYLNHELFKLLTNTKNMKDE